MTLRSSLSSQYANAEAICPFLRSLNSGIGPPNVQIKPMKDCQSIFILEDINGLVNCLRVTKVQTFKPIYHHNPRVHKVRKGEGYYSSIIIQLCTMIIIDGQED